MLRVSSFVSCRLYHLEIKRMVFCLSLLTDLEDDDEEAAAEAGEEDEAFDSSEEIELTDAYIESSSSDVKDSARSTMPSSTLLSVISIAPPCDLDFRAWPLIYNRLITFWLANIKKRYRSLLSEQIRVRIALTLSGIQEIIVHLGPKEEVGFHVGMPEENLGLRLGALTKNSQDTVFVDQKRIIGALNKTTRQWWYLNTCCALTCFPKTKHCGSVNSRAASDTKFMVHLRFIFKKSLYWMARVYK